MSYYRTCPNCDCLTHQVCAEARETFPERFTGKTDWEVVAAQGAANTRDGRAEQIDKAVSASIMNETEEKVK